jgi:ribosomal protein S25
LRGICLHSTGTPLPFPKKETKAENINRNKKEPKKGKKERNKERVSRAYVLAVKLPQV